MFFFAQIFLHYFFKFICANPTLMSSAIKTLNDAAFCLFPLVQEGLTDDETKKYNDKTWTLKELDLWKEVSLPLLLQSRHEKDQSMSLTKHELTLLMDWKLAHGKFRPTLPKLIASNTEESVESVTRAGFDVFLAYANKFGDVEWLEISLAEYKDAVKGSVKALTQLRGVGPATASLMLSLLWNHTTLAPPFFSDEGFMYFIRDALRPLSPIKYNVKEYVDEYIPLLVNISKQLDFVNPFLLDRAAWALKMYDIHRTSRLSNIELPEVFEKSNFEFFPLTSDILDEVQDKKRPAEVKASASKKKKLKVE